MIRVYILARKWTLHFQCCISMQMMIAKCTIWCITSEIKVDFILLTL